MKKKPKRILLIEDNKLHAEETKKIIEELTGMYDVKDKCFVYLPQNGHDLSSQCQIIESYIRQEIDNDSFDILMIDMLLGGDSAENPLGLILIKKLFKSLKKKSIVIYTEMSSKQLDIVKKFNKTVHNSLRIVTKPSNFNLLSNRVDCDSDEHKKIIQQNNETCTLDKCSYKDRLKCDMKCIYYELEDKQS